LLDGLGFKVLGEGFAEESREFIVRGEAKCDELFNAEFVDVGAIFGGQERMEAQSLFEADEAVLGPKSRGAREAGHQEEDEGHEDPPQEEEAVIGPVVDGDVDGEDEVEKEHG
jgi:hypothetical protein